MAATRGGAPRPHRLRRAAPRDRRAEDPGREASRPEQRPPDKRGRVMTVRFKVRPLTRPIRPDITSAPDQTPAQRAGVETWRQEQEALRAQFDQEHPSSPADIAPDDEMELWNRRSAAFSAWCERRKGRTAAVSTPVWVDALNEWLIDNLRLSPSGGLLSRQLTAASLTLPFRLTGGGE